MIKTATKKGFNLFLETLDEDREQAAEKYIALRERLEKFFEWRNCENSEGLTDIVFDRVSAKIIAGEKIKNAEAYCVSVAKFVLLENRREVLKSKELDENSLESNSENIFENESETDEVKAKRIKCLDQCLRKLPEDRRKLLIGYFDTNEKTYISIRKKLADKHGINLNTLRIRVSRLKTKLEKCTKDCCHEN